MGLSKNQKSRYEKAQKAREDQTDRDRLYMLAQVQKEFERAQLTEKLQREEGRRKVQQKILEFA
jgi:hypothetical protein